MSPVSLYFIVGSIFVIVIGFDIYNWTRTHSFELPEIRITRLWTKMTFSVLILGLTLSVAAVLLNINLLSYRQPIPYSEIKTISLSDFRGFKLPNQTLDGMNDFAFIVTSIEAERSAERVKITSLFHPSRSYVYDQKSDREHLLNHELYHFHITEYFARLCRKKLASENVIPSASEINDLVHEYEVLESEMQREYDGLTYHGYLLGKQISWQKKVDSLLLTLENVKEPYIIYEH